MNTLSRATVALASVLLIYPTSSIAKDINCSSLQKIIQKKPINRQSLSKNHTASIQWNNKGPYETCTFNKRGRYSECGGKKYNTDLRGFHNLVEIFSKNGNLVTVDYVSESKSGPICAISETGFSTSKTRFVTYKIRGTNLTFRAKINDNASYKFANLNF